MEHPIPIQILNCLRIQTIKLVHLQITKKHFLHSGQIRRTMLSTFPEWECISVPWKCQIKCTMLLRDKRLQSSLQKIVTFMFQALVLVQNIVTSAWHFYLCCTALFCLLLYLYSIVTHSEAENCHFDVSGFYREAKYLHFLPVLDKLIKGT